MDLQSFLYWIVNSGGGAAVVSFLLEKWDWFQKQESQNKQWIFFGLTVLVTILGYAGVTYIPKDVIQSVAPIFAIIYASFASIFIGTKFHAETKLTPPEDKGNG